jgi:hypothetical protein
VQDDGRGHPVEQGISGEAIGYLSAGQQERDRAAEAVGKRVDLRGSSAPGTTYRLGEFPPLPPAAQR